MRLSPRAALVALLFVFILLAASFSAIVPLGEAPDEVSHQSYVRYVAENQGLPPVIEGTTVYGETFQPPLYYLLAAPLTAWLPRGDEGNLGFTFILENNPDFELGNRERSRVLLQPAVARWPWRGEALGWHLVRLFSVLLGTVTILATYRLATLLFPEEPWSALLAAALVALLPSFLALSASVTNDALATMLAALLLWQLAALLTREQVKGGPGWLGWAVAGLLGGLSVWAKASGWVFVGTASLAALLAARSAGAHRARGLIGRLLVMGGSWLVVVLPLWWINLQRSGDLMGRNIQRQVTEAQGNLSLAELWQIVQNLYRTWWVAFGGAVHLSFPTWLNLLLLLPLLLAGGGLLRRHRQREQASPATRLLLPLLATHVTLVLAAWLLWTGMVAGTGQGRLLFPALPAIAALLAGGLVAIRSPENGRRAGPALGWVMGAGMLPIAALLLILVPAYRATPEQAVAPAEQSVASWQAGELPLVLTTFHFPLTIDDRVMPGSESALYLGWHATAPLPDLRLRLRWIDRDGKASWVKEGSPIANHPLTDEWQPGEYAAWHRVLVPPTAEPGWYRLMLSVIDPLTGLPLPLHGPEGHAGDEIMIGQITVAAKGN